MEKRDSLKSRLGFLLLSAGCAIGCGNVWKFPWMVGQNGGGIFLLIYFACLIVLGIPVLIMELSIGRAGRKSILYVYQELEPKGTHWHIHGVFCLIGNIALMAFYTTVTGWMINYFVRFLTGNFNNIGFVNMISDPGTNVIYMAIGVVLTFVILSFNIQKGLEAVTKYMMILLFILMIVLCIHSFTLPGAKAGLEFYLVPRGNSFNLGVVTSAMNQSFFTLSLGIGAMAIFGSYTSKSNSLMTESINIVILDTAVALLSGFIMFPACATYNIELNAGPALLFDTMSTVFLNMKAGRVWGSLFFLFMIFAAFSTELAVCENISCCIREKTKWSRKKTSLICGVGIFLISLTTALGYSVFKFQPFGEGTAWLDFWDFIVSVNLLPLGSLVIALFCCYKIGWGWDKFTLEANTGKGLRVQNWMKPLFKYVVPFLIISIYLYGICTFKFK